MPKHERPRPAPKQHNASTPDADAFHGLAGRFVTAIEPHTEASTGALLLQFLVAFGFLVGRSAYYLADGARHYPNLFLVLVGDTAKARKGTSWNRVREIFETIPHWPRERVTTGLSSGEGLIEQVRDSEPDKRLLVIQSEFGSVLQVMVRSGNTLSPTLRDAWDGSDLRVMVKNQPASASGEHVAIIAHTTADELVLRLEATELWNGFANRFLWCAVARSKLLPHGGTVDVSIVRSLATDLGRIAKWASGRKQTRITWELATAKEWERVYASLSHTAPGLIGAVTSRGEAQVVRLALIYAMLDSSDEIRMEHLRAAFAVWKFCESSARHVFGRTTGSRTADRILEMLRQSKDGKSRTDISALFQHHQSTREISRSLELLKEMRLAESRLEKGAGRPTERWFATKK